MAAASEHTVLQFVAPSSTASATTSVLTARIHPLVIFNVCDCFVRRPDSAERVIGILLGSILPDGTVDIRNSYAFPHNESSDQVAVDIDYHHSMPQTSRGCICLPQVHFGIETMLVIKNHPCFPCGGAKDCEEGFEASKGKGKGCSQELETLLVFMFYGSVLAIVLVAEKTFVYYSKFLSFFVLVLDLGSVDNWLCFLILVHVEFS